MSRPVERIDEVLNELGKVWKQYPDMRLGQLLEVSAGRIGRSIWNLEDTELMAILELRLNSVVDKLEASDLYGDPFGPWNERKDAYKLMEERDSTSD